MPPKNQGDIKKVVLDFLNERNRPYSAINIVDELHGEYSKTFVQKALDALEEAHQITCEVYGKQKIYYALQEGRPVASSEELAQLDAENDQIQQEVSDLTARVRELRAKRDRLAASLPMDTLCSKRDELRQRLEEQKEKLERIIEESKGLTPEESDAIEKQYNRMAEIWWARKTKCRQIIDTITENMDKKTSEFMDELGIETDEQNHVKITKNGKQYTVEEV